MKKIMICLVIISCLSVGKTFAQIKITKSMAAKLGALCLSNQRALAIFANANDIVFTSDADKAAWDIVNHLDYAENFLIALYDGWGEESTYWTLREAWFTQEEIKQANQFYEQVLEKRRILRKKEEEAERQRKAAEERKIKASIDTFLVNRESTVYPADIYNHNANQKVLNKIVADVVRELDIQHLNLHITDSVTVHYSGVTNHKVDVMGLGSNDADLVNTLKNAIMSAKLTPMSQIEPVSKQRFPVTSTSTFTIDYNFDSQIYDLRVIKRTQDILLKKGNSSIFGNSKGYLALVLTKNGRYDLVLNVVDSCGVRRNGHAIMDFRKLIDNVFIEYTYSPTAPFGVVLGLNQIAYKKLGVYMSYKSAKRKTDNSNFDYYSDTHPKKDGYIRDAFTAGITIAILKNFYLYGGIGYGDCAVAYSHSGDVYANEKIYHRASSIKGLEVELGGRWRIWKSFGISAGYSAILPMQENRNCYFGDVNLGLTLFF